MQTNGEAVTIWAAPSENPDREAFSNINTSGIQPTEYRVLILPEDVGDRFEGSTLYRPDTVKERDQFAQMAGTIVAVSPVAFTYEQWPPGARIPQVGDKVLFGKYSGAIVKGRDKVDYRLVSDKDIGAILID